MIYPGYKIVTQTTKNPAMAGFLSKNNMELAAGVEPVTC
jgi:hypothetical protein